MTRSAKRGLIDFPHLTVYCVAFEHGNYLKFGHFLTFNMHIPEHNFKSIG